MRTTRKKVGASATRVQRAKVFWTGRSQAIRLPEEFRVPTAELAAHREGKRIVLEPVGIERDKNGWPLALWQLAGAAPEFDLGRTGDRKK